MFNTDDVDEAKRMLPIYKRAVDFLETVSGKKTEQAEQEPVAIMSPNKANIVGINTPYANIGTDDWIKLYAAPVRTKDLTEAEIDEIWKKHSGGNLGFAYAVIAADREKNRG